MKKSMALCVVGLMLSTVHGVLNVLDDDAKDIVYWYESFVQGFDTTPVDGRLSRAAEPRTVRLGLKYQF